MNTEKLLNYAAIMKKIADFYLEIGKQQKLITGFNINQQVITDQAWTFTVQQYGNFSSAQMEVEKIYAALDAVGFKTSDAVDYRGYSEDHVGLLAGLYNLKAKFFNYDRLLFNELTELISRFETMYPEALKGLDDLMDYLAD